MVVKVKGGSRVENTLSAILHYPLYKYVKYIQNNIINITNKRLLNY